MCAMKLLSLVGFFSAPSAMGRATEGLRGARWSGDDTGVAGVGSDPDASKSSGDFIDQYIASAGKSRGDVWLKKTADSAETPAFGTTAFGADAGSSSANKDADVADHFFDGDRRHHDTDSESVQAQPPSHDDMDSASAKAAPQSQQSSGGGAVVDVNLDSELQVGRAATGHRGSRWSGNADDNTATDASSDPFATPSDSASSGGDYMDRYITSAKNSGDGTWFAKPEAPAGGRDRDVFANFHADSAADGSIESHRDSSESRSHDDFNVMNMGSGQSEAQAPAEQQSSGGGGSVSVTLDSELQESMRATHRSLLQVGGKPKMDPSAVRSQVDSQTLQDIHIHDTFGQEAAADVVQEQEIKDSPDMKA